jgi:general secretion pathway protein D
VQTSLSSAGQGLNLAVIRGSINIGGIVVTNIALLARALESDANTNILSTPNLLTLDNEEAKIVVGQNVPFITGQYAVTGSATTPTPFQTIERKDVGLTLRVKPQITEGGTVRMTIYEEVSRIQDTTNVAGIITSKRSLESTVVVDDGQIIVLGGLIEDSFTDGSSRVPVVGDVPWLGALFRYDNRHRIKTNLMVFLKPTVIRTAGAGAALTSDRYDYLMGEQQRLRPAERPFWPDTTVPELPVLPNASPNAPPSGFPSAPAPIPGATPPAKPQ